MGHKNIEVLTWAAAELTSICGSQQKAIDARAKNRGIEFYDDAGDTHKTNFALTSNLLDTVKGHLKEQIALEDGSQRSAPAWIKKQETAPAPTPADTDQANYQVAGARF